FCLPFHWPALIILLSRLGQYVSFIGLPACVFTQLTKSAHHASLPRPKVCGYFKIAPSFSFVASTMPTWLSAIWRMRSRRSELGVASGFTVDVEPAGGAPVPPEAVLPLPGAGAGVGVPVPLKVSSPVGPRSARQVEGPAMPSTFNPFACWK